MQIAATTVEKSAQDIRKKYTSGTHVAKYKMTLGKYKCKNMICNLQAPACNPEIRKRYQEKLTSDIAQNKARIDTKIYNMMQL